jgi:hypothetical protein
MVVDRQAARMNSARRELMAAALRQLPPLSQALLSLKGRNGDTLDTDEAAAWKRAINFRLASYLHPSHILETHPGLGISTAFYRQAAPNATISALEEGRQPTLAADLVDVDPFGSPWGTLTTLQPVLSDRTVLLVSNGEAHAVRRNLRTGQAYPTQFWGKRLPLWVTLEYLPRLELITGLKVRFFYAFPTTIRAVLSAADLPRHLWEGCPRWMWWLQQYAAGANRDG